ncbi:TPA: hypothetical protein ACQJWS_005554, partial [Citrobacter freundii]
TPNQLVQSSSENDTGHSARQRWQQSPHPLRQEQNFLANDWKKKRRLKGAFLTVLRYRWERGVSRLFPRLLFPLDCK